METQIWYVSSCYINIRFDIISNFVKQNDLPISALKPALPTHPQGGFIQQDGWWCKITRLTRTRIYIAYWNPEGETWIDNYDIPYDPTITVHYMPLTKKLIKKLGLIPAILNLQHTSQYHTAPLQFYNNFFHTCNCPHPTILKNNHTYHDHCTPESRPPIKSNTPIHHPSSKIRLEEVHTICDGSAPQGKTATYAYEISTPQRTPLITGVATLPTLDTGSTTR